MPRTRRRLSDLEKEAQQSLYLVEIVWNDGVRTVFIIQSPSADYARNATEKRALSMWNGYIASTQVHPIPAPDTPNLPEHIYTDHSGYKASADVS